ncbi:hypothetical protein PENVUL_c007G03474 [Penicillium vulpinum]|uniref:Uncharacterized protein n=1 Tax=Penicillium vulpinum TaxID=29845 RepID=A0A1V6S5C4_9EURO|nr:hypothetical protein PENVUL_c007G03474 [Penicillium vulpinum]
MSDLKVAENQRVPSPSDGQIQILDELRERRDRRAEVREAIDQEATRVKQAYAEGVDSSTDLLDTMLGGAADILAQMES